MSGFDDKELFDNAMTDEAPAEQPNAEQPKVEAETGQQRDERGRYASAQPEGDEPNQEQASDPQAQNPEAGEQPVPGKRFGEVTRARDEALRQRDEAQAQIRDMEARFRALEARLSQPAQQQEQQQEPDILGSLLENPQAFLAQRDAQMLDQIGVTMARSTPEGAKAYDEAFDTLAAMKQQNPAAFQATYASLMNMPPLQRPQALVNWHKGHMTQQRVGNDPDAFFARTLEERLTSDPDFAKSLVEKLTGQARQQPQGSNGQPVLQLPPSLSRATSAAPAVGHLADTSDAAIFADALK